MIQILLLIIILILLTLSQLTLIFFPFFGVLFNAFLLFLLLVSAVYDVYDLFAKDVLALASVVPLLQLLAIALPQYDPFINTHITYLILLLLTALYLPILRIEEHLFKLKKWIFLPLSPFIGLILGFMAKILFSSSVSFIHVPLIPALFFLLTVACVEEIFFRGLLQNAVSFMSKPIIGVLFSSVVFTLFHITPNLLLVVFTFIASVFISSFYAYWKNIYCAILINLAMNITFYLLTGSLLFIVTH